MNPTGDIALIVSEHSTPQNLGAIVRVLRGASHKRKEFSRSDPNAKGMIWWIESLGGALALFKTSGAVHQVQCRAYPDCWLLPLRAPTETAVTATEGAETSPLPAPIEG